MVDRERLLEMLKVDEGLSLKPYLDTKGKMTIGYGRNLDDVGVTKEEAEQMLSSDMDDAVQDATEEWFEFWLDLTRVRREVLSNMMFNMGRTRFRKAKWPGLYGALKSRDYDEAAVEMLDSLWATQVDERAKRLANMMQEG